MIYINVSVLTSSFLLSLLTPKVSFLLSTLFNVLDDIVANLGLYHTYTVGDGKWG